MSTEINMHNIEVDCFSVVPYIENALLAGLVPILLGKPGIGKSATFKAIADKYNLKLIDIRLAQIDPCDLNGYLIPNKETMRVDFMHPAIFPVEEDEVPEGYSGWLILFDEITNANNAVQGAAYKVLLDRMIGQRKIHSKALMCGAGNSAVDRAAAFRLNTAMQSRLMHLRVKSNFEKWLEYAVDNNLDHRIRAFIRFKPDMLNNFDPNHQDQTYSCERTWEMASRYIDAANNYDRSINLSYNDFYIPLAGIIGQAAAMEFIAFSDLYTELYTIDDILADPIGIPMPERLDICYALTSTLAMHINPSNADKLIEFIKRMNIEFQIIIVREACSRDPKIREHQVVSKWALDVARRQNRINL